MKIKNTTSKIQQLRVLELPGEEAYDVYIGANGVIDLQGAIISDVDRVKFEKGIFQCLDGEIKSTPIEEEEDQETVGNEQEGEDEDLTPDEGDTNGGEGDTPEADTPSEGSFICKECGAEFASERGLNSHMSRTHSGE